MKRGRKPKPNELKILGGCRPDRINAEAPKAGGKPERPDWLEGAAVEAWDKLVPQLEAMGVLGSIDSLSLAVLVKTYADWLDAECAVKQHGAVVETGTGSCKISPYVAIAQELKGQLVKLLDRFGGSPSARAGLKTSGATDAPKDELAEFLARRSARRKA